MDPLTAFATAGTVIQFVDFTAKVLSTTYRLSNRRGEGSTPEHEDLEFSTRAFTSFTAKLRRSISSVGSTSPIPEEQQALLDLCARSDEIARDLLCRIKRVTNGASNGIFQNFRVALKSTWSKRDLDRLLEKLKLIKESIEIHVLVDLREQIDLISVQQSDRFDRLDTASQAIVTALLDFRGSQSDDQIETINAIAQMLDRTEIVIQREHDATRSIIVSAIEGAARAIARREHLSVSEFTEIVAIQDEEQKLREQTGRALLEMLYFPGMSDRHQEVSSAHKRTFRWILQDGISESQCRPSDDFRAWLSKDRGIYWINGKAGSGKSTLMKYIFGSPTTHELLSSWAGKGRSLVTVAHFFWNSGTAEQKSQAGLLRSLLYNVLSQIPELLPIAFPSYWARTYSDLSTSTRYLSVDIQLPELIRGFEILAKNESLPAKLCLFVDGLDEYAGDHGNIADLFIEVAKSTNIKLCVSSRPLLVFEDAFTSFPHLRLQELTQNDISNYTVDTLNTNRRYQHLLSEDPWLAGTLTSEIVSKADGVFLWVILVVKSLLDGITNRDGIDDLLKRLRILPGDLEELFTYMLSRIDPFYKEKTSKVFQIVRAAYKKPITIIALSFAMDEDAEKVFRYPIKALETTELERLGKLMTDRLNVYSAGLLEVSGIDSADSCWETNSAFVIGKVQHFHRTVRDYLEQSDVWDRLLESSLLHAFRPNLALLRSCIFQLKTASCRPLSSPMRNKVFNAMTYAARLDLDGCLEPVRLLPELDRTMTALALGRVDSTSPNSSLNYRHWFSYFPSEDDLFSEWQNNFVSLVVIFQMSNYMDHMLNADPDLIHKPGRPLIDYIVGRQGNKNSASSTSHKIVETLLKHGASPSTTFKGITAWENALISIHTLHVVKEVLENRYFIIKAFLQHGADPNALCVTTSGLQSATWILEQCFGRWNPPVALEIKSMLVSSTPAAVSSHSSSVATADIPAHAKLGKHRRIVPVDRRG